MKLNVGDYVRTKDYGFIKIKSFYYSEDMIHILDENCNEYDFSKELVDDFKSSPNIIDLIDVGDYVNGHRVVEKLWLSDTDGEYDEYRGAWCVFCESCSTGYEENEIETIVTKEQFEAMQYVVGEK